MKKITLNKKQKILAIVAVSLVLIGGVASSFAMKSSSLDTKDNGKKIEKKEIAQKPMTKKEAEEKLKKIDLNKVDKAKQGEAKTLVEEAKKQIANAKDQKEVERITKSLNANLSKLSNVKTSSVKEEPKKERREEKKEPSKVTATVQNTSPKTETTVTVEKPKAVETTTPKQESPKKKTGHYEKKLVKAAWTEDNTKYYIVFATTSGNTFRVQYHTKEEANSLMDTYFVNGYNGEEVGSYSLEQTGGIVEHPAVYEDVWVED